MAFWNQGKRYTVDKAIVAFSDGVETPRSVTVTSTYVSPDEFGFKEVPAGLFVGELADGTMRFLPRGKVTAAFSTGAATGTVSPYNVFVPGDVLYATEASVKGTFALTWAAGDTLAITIDGDTRTYTAADNVLANIATLVANGINADFGSKVRAYSVGADLYISSVTGVEYAVAESDTTAGDGTFAFAGSATALAFNDTAIGTIASINATTGVITLTGNATAALPVGASIGIRGINVLGLFPHSVDFTDRPQCNLALITGAHGVYQNALPYIDGELIRKFPKILFADKF